VKVRIKEMNKVWKTLKTAFKWLFIIILIFLLISLIKDFLDHYHFLVEKVNQQSHHIDLLQGNLHDAKEVNSHLISQLQIEHSKVEHLQNELSLKINGQPVHITVDDIKEEIEPQLKFPDLSPSFLPITIIGIMGALKPFLFRLAF
jgi:hypothetical protein